MRQREMLRENPELRKVLQEEVERRSRERAKREAKMKLSGAAARRAGYCPGCGRDKTSPHPNCESCKRRARRNRQLDSEAAR